MSASTTPAAGTTTGTAHPGGPVDTAVHAAHAAARATRTTPPAERAAWLRAAAASLEAAAGPLLQLAAEESSLPAGRLRGELTRTAFQLRLLAAEAASGIPLGATIDHADPGWAMGPRPDLRRVGEPLGAVAVFGAANFPFAFSALGGDTAAALAAGCAVVHKANPAHPRLAAATAAAATAALRAAGAPDGLFSLIDGFDAGAELVAHPLVRAVGFTGSTRGGLALAAIAASRREPIPFYGELGSTNPVFVTPAAWAVRRDSILAGFAGSFTAGMGQFCTKPGFLVVPAGDREAIAAALRAAPAGPVHPMLTAAMREGFEASLAEFSRASGAGTLVTLGGSDTAPPATVLIIGASAVIDQPHLLQHEIFGPASVIIEYDDQAQPRALAGLAGGQLAAGLHAEPDEDVADLVEALAARAGRVLWNGWPTGVSVSFAQQHGGPFPATTAPTTTSVGTAAIGRFLRPVAYQDVPDAALPPALREANPWRIVRRVDGTIEIP